jgi:hypothetical protein
VDGGRRAINKTVDIAVTSVHQTTAGKMIFGRYDERGDLSRHTAAHGSESAARLPGAANGTAGDTPSVENLPRSIIPDPSHS